MEENLDDYLEAKPVEEFKPWGMDVNTYCMLLHLSGWAGYIIPLAGVALPIIMWATNKDQSPMVDRQGKIVINWIISSAIYMIIGVFLSIIFIGIFIIVAVAIMSVVYSIIGAIKASNGEVFEYPMSIRFLK